MNCNIKVKEHYNKFPYDPYMANDDLIIHTFAENIDFINYHFYRGKHSFNNFRILVAGCGVGDTAIYLAKQLEDKENIKIIGIDISSESLKICERKAKHKKLKNVEFLEKSILDLEKWDIEKFDFINCCGVIHHIDNTDEALRQLTTVLKDDGGMSIMVYGKYGRIGLEQLRDTLKLIHKKNDDEKEAIENTKEIIYKLPKTNILKLQKKGIHNYTSAETYDSYFHTLDKSYGIEDIYKMLEKANLRYVAPDPTRRPHYNIDYLYLTNNIMKHINNKDDQKASPSDDPEASQSDEITKKMICERLRNDLDKHQFYCTKKNNINTEMSINDRDNIPFFLSTIEKDLFDQLKQKETLRITSQFTKTSFALNHNNCLRYFFIFVNGKNTIEKIINLTKRKLKNTNKKLIEKRFNNFYNLLFDHRLIFLKTAN